VDKPCTTEAPMGMQSDCRRRLIADSERLLTHFD